MVRKLRTIREDQQVSLRMLARHLQVNYSLISYWETGSRNPSQKNAEKLEKFFDEDIETLLKEDPSYTGGKQLTH